MLAAVTALNRQITDLAPVLNSPTLTNAAAVSTSNPDVPVATMAKRFDRQTYLFAVAMWGQATTTEFSLKPLTNNLTVEVIRENRSLVATNAVLSDHLKPWDVHLYRFH